MKNKCSPIYTITDGKFRIEGISKGEWMSTGWSPDQITLDGTFTISDLKLIIKVLEDYADK